MLNGSWQLPRWPRGGSGGNHSGPEHAPPPSRTRALNPEDGSDRSNHYTHTHTHTHTHKTGFVLSTDAAEGHPCVCLSTTEGAGDDRLGWRAL